MRICPLFGATIFQGMVRHGSGEARRGNARYGMVRQGSARHGKESPLFGAAPFAVGIGKAWQCPVGFGTVS